MLTNLWPSKESTECHCKCICPPLTAARCLNWGKIGENRNSRSLAEELSVGSVAQLHHSDSTEYSRLSICHPLTSAPFPSSFSNFLVKLSDHHRSLAHSPAHESRSQFVDTQKLPQPDPNLAILTPPTHLALGRIADLGGDARRQVALLPIGEACHPGHRLHPSCAHGPDWAPR